MYRLTLIVRGLWSRRGFTLAMLIVAAITTAAAALGPLYARAAAESTLRDQLATAPVTSTGVHYAETGDVSTNLTYQSVLDEAPKAGAVPGYPTRITGIYAKTPAVSSAATVHTAVLWRQGICRHLVIVSGRCPTGPRQVLVSQRTVDARVYGWRLGGTIRLSALQVQALDAKGFPIGVPARTTIVGTYRPVSTADPYWFGQNYFDAHPGTNGPDTVDAVVVARDEFTSLAPPFEAQVDVDLPLDVDAVRWATVPKIERGLDALTQHYFEQAEAAPHTELASVIAAARHQRSLVDVGTTLVTVQLGLLAWLVLFQVVSDAAEARANDIALSKLRGRGSMPTLRFGLGEPLVLLALAIPLGLLLALLATHVFAAAVLATRTPVVLPWGAVAAALVAFGGGVLAALVAAARTLRRPVLEQWRRSTSRPRRSWLGFALDLVIAAAAVLALAVLRAHHHTGTGNDTAALLAPGLLVTAVALLGVRLLPLTCRALARPTRSSRRMGAFLAVRQVGRQASGLRLAALLAIALGLASFAVAGEAVARANRTHRAQAELGADRVVSIQYDPSHDPVAAVRRADPDGRWAMAAATWLPDGGDSVVGTVLGVDASRLAAVGYPAAGGPAVSTIAATIAASSAPLITITAPRMRLRIDATGLSDGPQPQVRLDFDTPAQPFQYAYAGPLRPGTHDYVTNLPCAAGCNFRGITWDRSPLATNAQRGIVTVSAIDVGHGTSWTPLPARLTQPSAWRAAVPIGQASDSVRAGPGGVQDAFFNTNGGYGGVVYASAPSPLPAVATPPAVNTGTGEPNPPQMLDTTQTTAYFRVRHWAPVLPAVLANGVIMDVRYLTAELPAFAGEADWQVWLSPHAPGDALRRLSAAGLVVQGVKTEHSRVAALGRQGPALALLLLLACALAGAALAVGGTAISVSAASRRRSYELASLRAVGTPRRTLIRAGVLEQLLLLGTAIVLGLPSGIAAARLALPAIPEFADHTPVALHYGTPAAPVALFAAGFVLLLVLTAIVAGYGLVRVAVPSRLREAEE